VGTGPLINTTYRWFGNLLTHHGGQSKQKDYGNLPYFLFIMGINSPSKHPNVLPAGYVPVSLPTKLAELQINKGNMEGIYPVPKRKWSKTK
jgi:hypothetical protein